MKKTIVLIGVSAVFSVLAWAGSWSGRLLDAACYDQHKDTNSCAAKSSTTNFLFETSGKFYKLDADGNSKAAAAVKNRADRSADPSKPQATEVMAEITGTEKDDTIEVETIEVR